MGLVGLALGTSALVYAGRFGKELIKDLAVKSSGAAGKEMIENVFKSSGWSKGFIPFYGPMHMAGRQIASGFAGFRKVGEYHSAWRATERELAGELGNVWKQKFAQTIPDLKMRQDAVRAHVSFVKTLRTNPRQYADDLTGAWNRTMAGYGIPGGDPLAGRMTSSLEKYRNLAQQAQAAGDLFGASLASNMAVVGIPTLSSSVASYAIGKAMYGRAQRRMRGYDSVY